MAVDSTLRSIVSNRSLRIRVLVGADLLDSEIVWVATSEHEDPSQYLNGREILLTTGMRFSQEQDFYGYVERLTKVGVVALGFGLGPAHDTVPLGLVAAAEQWGMILLEIASPTPFIAVTKAVADLIANREHAAESRDNQIRQSLTRAALRGGADALVEALAKESGSWAALLSPVGIVRQITPRRAGVRLDDIRDVLVRTRESGSFGSASVIANGERIEILPVGRRSRQLGTLVVGSTGEVRGQRSRFGIIAAEVLGLELELESTRKLAERRRLDALVMILDNQLLPIDQLTVLFGDPLTSGRIAIAVVHVPKSERDEIRGELEAYRSNVIVAQYKSRLVMFMSERHLDVEAIERSLVNASTHAVGIAVARGIEHAERGVKQADRAATAAAATNMGVLQIGSQLGPTYSAMLAAADEGEIAASIFASIETADEKRAGDLCRTVIAWLGLNGQVEPTAGLLGVHRHTLRARVRRIERLIGQPLSDPTTRAELWFAALQRYPQLSEQATDWRRNCTSGSVQSV
ncbi:MULTISPECIES: PucR family transcriptional regulator [Rhodococcus]|uniref:PucR family transcriptional regulator n=1 Tax=Rhodococcus globerulus TaxID=33008 RepID=A0ABU4BYM9_RHOGO|nr:MULTISPECIES: PucR family transcriptional regulator [Rhodococcus]MDV6269295.1 PucR family transcriptional regulator [Rhodococcus globerulus]MDV8066644.1 PucR family transcriptional regulator [Rhodococcus sp. IEGM 1366]